MTEFDETVIVIDTVSTRKENIIATNVTSAASIICQSTINDNEFY